jgi:filamentous hemagglutinin
LNTPNAVPRSVGAVVTPPVVACGPGGCIVTPPVAAPGTLGSVPGNAILSSGDGGGGATGTDGSTANTAPSTPLTDGGGLQVYEDAGGHLIERHVGMSDADLANRLSTSNVSSASTFTDRAAAETAVSAAVDSNQTVIQNYLSGNSNGYLAIEYTSPTPVGTSLSRGSTSSVSVNSFRVVLAKDPTMSTGYRIVTGYPHQ